MVALDRSTLHTTALTGAAPTKRKRHNAMCVCAFKTFSVSSKSPCVGHTGSALKAHGGDGGRRGAGVEGGGRAEVR